MTSLQVVGPFLAILASISFYLFPDPSCRHIAYHSIHLNDTHLSAIEDTFHNNLFGQNTSVDLIISAFRTRENNRPLSFHFVGENGVGKTLASQLVGRTLFYNPKEDVLYIRGNSYQTLLQENIEQYRSAIRKKVFDYIARCPYGLIIVDEVETIHPKIISLFQEFLDCTFTTETWDDKKKVSMDKAIFIFISDFGSEGYTHNMTVQDIMTLVRVESEKQWQNYKQISLIQHIVPFLPMTKEGVQHQVQHLIENLRHHDRLADFNAEIKEISFCSPNVIETISNHIYKEAVERLAPENYRGVGKIFSNEVTNPFLKSIQKFTLEHEDHTPAVTVRERHERRTGREKMNLNVFICMQEGAIVITPIKN